VERRFRVPVGRREGDSEGLGKSINVNQLHKNEEFGEKHEGIIRRKCQRKMDEGEGALSSLYLPPIV